MRTEACREWRESLGPYAIGRLAGEERAALQAHLAGCPACRAEAESLMGVAERLSHADPAHLQPAPQVPPRLAGRVLATIDAERRSVALRRRRRRRVRLGVGAGATAALAAAAAAIAIFVVGGGSAGAGPSRWVAFHSLPAGMKIDARLTPRPYGTEIHMYVAGVRSGTLCRVSLRGPNGARQPAGTFRYRYGGGDEAVLSSALDLSSAQAIVVHVGRRTFVAPVGSAGAEQQTGAHNRREHS